MSRIMTRDRVFYKDFLRLTIMMALQNLIVCTVNLADNIMLGTYSETAMAGVSQVNLIQFFLQMLTMGIGEGIMVLAAQYWGKKDTSPIRKILSIGLKLGLGCGFVLWLLAFLFPYQLVGLFSHDPAIIQDGVEYLRVVCFSYFFFSITNILVCAFRSVETTFIGIMVSITGLVINVCLNYTFIFGHFGAPRMGAAGAAVATLIARVAEFGILVFYLFFRDKKICFQISDLFRFDPTLFRDFLRVGLFVVFSNGIWGAAMSIQAIILGHIQAEAASGIASTIFQIISVVLFGSNSAAAVLTGRTVGEGATEKVKEYAKTMQILFLLIGAATGLSLFLVKDFVLGFYQISAANRELTNQFILILCVTSVGTAYQCSALTGIVRGGGDTRFVFFNDMIFMWMIVLPLAGLAAYVWNLSAAMVFLILKSDQITKCFVAVVKTNRFRWIKQLTRDQL